MASKYNADDAASGACASELVDGNDSSWPVEDLELVQICPLCGGKDRDRIFSGLSDRNLFGAPGSWTLYECRNCQTGYLDPRPTAGSMGRAYERYYTHDAPASAAQSYGDRRMRAFAALVNGYSNWRYGTKFRPSARLGIIAALCLPSKRSLLDRKFRHWPSKRDGGQKLLDVGLGSGAFMELAQAAGWAVTGVDLDEKTVKNARDKGLNAIFGDIEALMAEAETFDYITISHVIEHVYDPRAVLGCAYRLLKPGGRIWIETPNWHAIGRRIYGCSWRGLEPPRHVVLFSWDALVELLERTGFSNVKPIPVRAVTSHVFQASDALVRGVNPYSRQRYSRRAKLRALVANVYSRLDFRASEFITLTAEK
jgi:2-polyprenyl-3-methyl-5-hydroxy-6-metoxy-1,4-benzoquinol methylase